VTRYSVSESAGQGATAYRLMDATSSAEVVVYPAYGQNAVSFRTTPDGGRSGTEALDVLVPPENAEQLRENPISAGNPLLFPFPNRVRDGIYTFEGQTYRMDRLMALKRDSGAGHAIHGLVADKSWTVESASADEESAFVRASLQLDAHPDIFEQYPFPCRLTVTYRLRGGVLIMETEVENTGEKTLPMGFGIHPWFPVALRPGQRLPEGLAQMTKEQRPRAEVKVPCAARWELEKLMPTGNVVPVSGPYNLRNFCPLAGDFFDDVFTQVEPNRHGWSESAIRDPETGMEAYLAADSGFREWVFYAPLERPVVALEPYTCPTDAVNLQARGIDAGLIALEPGSNWAGVIQFGLRRV
jgi:aldose 1-epimerase